MAGCRETPVRDFFALALAPFISNTSMIGPVDVWTLFRALLYVRVTGARQSVFRAISKTTSGRRFLL